MPGIGSDRCAGIVKESIRRLPGIGDVQTSIASLRVKVDFDGRQTEAAAIRATVERSGYDVDSVAEAADPSTGRK